MSPVTSSMRLHRSPSTAPALTNAVIQTRLPTKVSTLNRTNGMRSNPAGIDTSERTMGMHRPRSTAASARRTNQASARSKWRAVSPDQAPYFSRNTRTRSGPIAAETPYSTQFPTNEPTLATAIIAGSEASPRPTTKPARGSVMPAIGGNTVSSRTSSITPT